MKYYKIGIARARQAEHSLLPACTVLTIRPTHTPSPRYLNPSMRDLPNRVCLHATCATPTRCNAAFSRSRVYGNDARVACCLSQRTRRETHPRMHTQAHRMLYGLEKIADSGLHSWGYHTGRDQESMKAGTQDTAALALYLYSSRCLSTPLSPVHIPPCRGTRFSTPSEGSLQEASTRVFDCLTRQTMPQG